MDMEFALDPGLIYLNHAAVAPWPRRTAQAVQNFAEQNLHRGSCDYPAWLHVERELRTLLQQLINAPSADDIALLKNTSEALSVVAHGLDWRDGDNVVLCTQEFPSNRIVWESLRRYGVECRIVPINARDPDPETAFLNAVDGRTRLLAVSSVQYASGLRMDLERLGTFCNARGVLFCVDAIQSLGALRFDAQALHADFVVADGHKWLLGPEGLALFYCRPELRDRLRLHQYGWHMVEHTGDFDRTDWQPAATAQRFECGSPNMLGIHALHASVSLLLETGLETIAQQILKNAQYLFDLIGNNKDHELITPTQPGRYAGIVTFRSKTTPATILYEHLTSQGVICAQRAGGIRFSPHFYTPPTHLKQACAIVGTVPK